MSGTREVLFPGSQGEIDAGCVEVELASRDGNNAFVDLDPSEMRIGAQRPTLPGDRTSSEPENENRTNRLSSEQKVLLKLTLPEQDNFYADCVKHPNVLKVVALSGGYTRQEANARLSRNNGAVASFSRALSEGLTAQQNDAEFGAMLDSSIESIYQASKT